MDVVQPDAAAFLEDRRDQPGRHAYDGQIGHIRQRRQVRVGPEAPDL
jgi:hypothetical protein